MGRPYTRAGWGSICEGVVIHSDFSKLKQSLIFRGWGPEPTDLRQKRLHQRGSLFTLVMIYPVWRITSGHLPVLLLFPARPMSAAQILVVEDNDFVRMQIVRFLKDAGHETVEAKDGHEALGLMSADIAAAVVDVRMEPMGGLDFIRAVRGRDLETPVILVTGDQTTDLLEQAAKWGVGAVLIKPVVKDRLIKAIERVLVARGT